MSEYEEILGIKIPENTKIKAVTNSSKKVTKDSIFLDSKELKFMAASMLRMPLRTEHHWLFTTILCL